MKLKRQITLTGEEGKQLIAKAAAQHSKVRQCLEQSKVLLIGGTTVSALSEELGYGPMRISGRIDASGTRTALRHSLQEAHNLLIENGRAFNADDDIIAIASALTNQDLVVIGANAMDTQGRVALAFASQAGDRRGLALQSAFMQGAYMLILCGMSKLIPSVGAAMSCSDRTGIDLSMGAAIDLYNVYGPIITEIDAFKILFDVVAVAIAGDGFGSGAGTRTYVLHGADHSVRDAWELALSLKGARTSGVESSLAMCHGGCVNCCRHVGCIYKLRTEQSENMK